MITCYETQHIWYFMIKNGILWLATQQRNKYSPHDKHFANISSTQECTNKPSNDAINELGGLNKNQLKRLLLNLKHEKKNQL